jgi:hypothetical protein
MRCARWWTLGEVGRAERQACVSGRFVGGSGAVPLVFRPVSPGSSAVTQTVSSESIAVDGALCSGVECG